jgi:2-haloacid dehalogenase
VRRAGLADLVLGVLSSEDSHHYKPAREAYLHAARALETVPSHITLVAAHSWDCQGAKHAGLGAAWVRRHEHAPNPAMTAPDVRGDDLFAVAEQLASLPLHA